MKHIFFIVVLCSLFHASVVSCIDSFPGQESVRPANEIQIVEGDAGARPVRDEAMSVSDAPVEIGFFDGNIQEVPDVVSGEERAREQHSAEGLSDGGPEDSARPLPVCPCFARAGWCGASAGVEAKKRGCQIPLLPEHNDSILHCPDGKWSVKESCKSGCFAAPPGSVDYCKGAPCSCLLGDGPYCGARAKELANGASCTIGILAGHEKDLLKCVGGNWSVLKSCSGSCSYNKSDNKLNDECVLQDCKCFVKVAWCGAGAAKEAAKRDCKIPLLPKHNNDILYCPGGKWGVKQRCPNGCIQAPTGTPDSCKTSASYLLPFSCGAGYRCSSGNHTSNHNGKDAYAYDFAMPVGTTVRAMRGGRVLRVRNVSRPGSSCYSGGGSACANYANTVEIIHSDNTVALYMHLSVGTVSPGQNVKQGSVIGKSGNSGWSTGPHVHVQVQRNCGIWWCQSIPFRFGEKSTISSGTYVTSKNCP